jgi:5-methylthioribose kinase
MSQYHQFSSAEAAEFANKYSDLFGERSKLTTQCFGDTHMNLVFRVQNQAGTSLIVKQGLPFARGLSERWPLTLERRRIEAEALKLFAKAAPELVVEVLHYDATQAAMLLEDLGQLDLLEPALIQGRQFHQLGRQLGEFLAKIAVSNSDFMLALPQQRARQQQFQNPEPRQITEDLLFNDPYCHHERNEVPAALRLQVQQLWQHEALLAQVAKLKHAFRCQADTLTHGDFTCGSVFVGKTSLKVIDAEFAGFGPHGFDLGMMLGSLMLHYCAAAAKSEPAAKEQQQYLFSQIKQLLLSYQELFVQQLAQCRDVLLSNAEFQQQLQQDALKLAVGMAGCEMIRRIYGAFPAACLQQLPLAQRTQAQLQALALGQRLILQHSHCTDSAQVLAWLQMGVAS